MNSLWLSLTAGTEQPAVHEAARRYLDGWLTAQQIGNVLTVISELVRHTEIAGRSGELILSRHDDTLLIEVVDPRRLPVPTPAGGRTADSSLNALPLHAYRWGTHSTNTGTVVWVAMPLDTR